MNYAICVENLRKSYTNGHEVLKGISFKVNQGEIFTLLGLNGAGKTTTIKSILNIIGNYKGEVKVFGFDNKKNRKRNKGRYRCGFG